MNNIEKQIADKILITNGLTAAKLGLRFDKVVVRLLGNLRTSLERYVHNGETIIVTVTAPIRLPAKTEFELIELIKNILESGARNRDRTETICGNAVRIRVVKPISKRADKFIGLVHNPGIDSKHLIDLAAEYVLQ